MKPSKHSVLIFSDPDPKQVASTTNDVRQMLDSLSDGGEATPVLDTDVSSLPMATVLALASWAKGALKLMEQEKEWSGDLLDDFSQSAIDRGLAKDDDDAFFKVDLK